MKKMSKNVLFIVIGILLAFTIDVAAEAVISSGAVSYSNTTVSAALDELFSAVDINNKIGTTDISTIGDGTITGAISKIKSELDYMHTVDTIDNLYEFTGTVATNFTMSHSIYEYRFIILSIYDKNDFVVNSVIYPRGTMLEKRLALKIYGQDSTQWGSLTVIDVTSTDTTIQVNRTSSNTSKLVVFGVE